MPQSEFKIGVILKGKMADAFREEVNKTMATNAAFTRLLIEEGLRRRGHDVEDQITWGGHRKTEDDEQGQAVAVATA